MNVFATAAFKSDLNTFPDSVKRKLAKQTDYLVANIRHPSLRAKKYDESRNVWQARVDRDIRFYFRIEGDRYVLLTIKKHPK